MTVAHRKINRHVVDDLRHLDWQEWFVNGFTPFPAKESPIIKRRNLKQPVRLKKAIPQGAVSKPCQIKGPTHTTNCYSLKCSCWYHLRKS